MELSCHTTTWSKEIVTLLSKHFAARSDRGNVPPPPRRSGPSIRQAEGSSSGSFFFLLIGVVGLCARPSCRPDTTDDNGRRTMYTFDSPCDWPCRGREQIISRPLLFSGSDERPITILPHADEPLANRLTIIVLKDENRTTAS